MNKVQKTYLFRLTHIKNIPHIVKHGITHYKSKNANSKFVPIGDKSLIQTRNNHFIQTGMKLGDYIPFYFAKRTPMLYVVQNGFNNVGPISAEKIVYCVSSVERILELNLEFIFTNGHAKSIFSSFYDHKDINRLNEVIDWDAIAKKYWLDESDLDLKRRKEAEFLISGDIPIEAILGYVVYNKNAENQLLNLGIDQNMIHVDSNYYF